MRSRPGKGHGETQRNWSDICTQKSCWKEGEGHRLFANFLAHLGMCAQQKHPVVIRCFCALSIYCNCQVPHFAPSYHIFIHL